jgi:signal transduction histidine kinase
MMMGRGPGHRMMEDLPEERRAVMQERHAAMMFVWGRRWAPPLPEGDAPPAVRDRTFWEGTRFGVATAARSFPGIIAVHADAEAVRDFGREIGVQRQVEELGRQPGIESIAILDERLTAVAHSSPSRVGQREEDDGLSALGRSGGARMVSRGGGAPILEVVRPLALAGERTGLLRVGLSTAAMERAWRRDRLAAALLSLGVLALGTLGLGAVFYTQHRHLGRIRALEAEMGRRERLSQLGGVAAGVAHEIRNPLNAVSMGLQRLRAEFAPPDDEEYRKLIGVVQGEVKRLNGIVEDFLSLARPPALRIEPVAPGALVDEVLALLEGDMRRAGVRVERQVEPDLPAVPADRDRLKQVLLNLLLNATEALPRGGVVTVAAGRRGEDLALTVSDTGPGIPPEVLARAFEPYVTTKPAGTGLGLAIARRLVEAHGGRVEAANQAGGGASLTVTLPLAGPPGG